MPETTKNYDFQVNADDMLNTTNHVSLAFSAATPLSSMRPISMNSIYPETQPDEADINMWNEVASRIYFATGSSMKSPKTPENHGCVKKNVWNNGPVEPSNEPCTDEIPYTDLVYWLGNTATGEVECSCSTCMVQNYSRAHHYSSYMRLSSKIPVLSSMPRIEGVN
jgi:hypothetical protein